MESSPIKIFSCFDVLIITSFPPTVGNSKTFGVNKIKFSFRKMSCELGACDELHKIYNNLLFWTTAEPNQTKVSLKRTYCGKKSKIREMLLLRSFAI